MEPWAAVKKLLVSMAVPAAPVRIPSQRSLAPSVVSVTSVVNDKDDKGEFFWRSWSHRLRPKKLHASVTVPGAPVRVPSKRPLAPSVASVTSVANDKLS